MQEKYDVIIVGAGVSGYMLAKLLDASDLRVLLLEKNGHFGCNPKTFGTFTQTAKEHHLEKHIDKYFDTWAFYGPKVKVWRSSPKILCLVNYNKWMQEQALRKITFKTNINLTKAHKCNGGIELTDSKNKKYFGHIIIDSSGYSQVVRKLLGLPTSSETGLSFEVEMENCNLQYPDEAAFFLDFHFSNSGGWIYNLSPTRAQYGWADFFPESKSDLNDLKKRTINSLKTGKYKKMFKNANITYSFGRFGPTGNTKPEVSDHFIAIGDAGNCGTPLTLEGFRQALDSAKMAHHTISEAFKKSDFSKSQLQLFSQLFYGKYGKYYRQHRLVRYIYLHWARNEEIDRWLLNFKKLNTQEYFKMIKGEYSIRLLAKTLDLILTKNILLNMINNALPSILRFRKQITPSKKESLYG